MNRRSRFPWFMSPEIRDNVIALPLVLISEASETTAEPKRSKGCQGCQTFLLALLALKGLAQRPHVASSALAKSRSVRPAGSGKGRDQPCMTRQGRRQGGRPQYSFSTTSVAGRLPHWMARSGDGPGGLGGAAGASGSSGSVTGAVPSDESEVGRRWGRQQASTNAILHQNANCVPPQSKAESNCSCEGLT